MDHFDMQYFTDANITFLIGIAATIGLLIGLILYVNCFNALINTSYVDYLALYRSLHPDYSSFPIFLK